MHLCRVFYDVLVYVSYRGYMQVMPYLAKCIRDNLMNQGGTTDMILFVLDRSGILSRTF